MMLVLFTLMLALKQMQLHGLNLSSVSPSGVNTRKLLSQTSSSEQIFTTNQTSNSFGHIKLINNSYNSITSNTWQCDNFDWNLLCLYLTLFNSACPAIETIRVTTKGVSVVSGDPDPYFVLAVKNSNDSWDFISFLADGDGYVWTALGSATGGVFVAPNCGSTHLLNTGDIFTIWSDYGSMTKVTNNRIPLSNYDLNNWELLTGTRLGDTTDPITITIENDIVLNTVNVKFAENSIGSVNCTFNQAFDTFESGNDWIVLIMTDDGIVSYSEFIIDTECSIPTIAPTMNPSNISSVTPSAVPSQSPSLSPTQIPTHIPSSTPSSELASMCCQLNVYK